MSSAKAMIAAGLVIGAFVALHPPWQVRVKTSRMNFDGFPAVPPTTVFDSATWMIPFAPIYSEPSLALPPAEVAAYQARLGRGDTTAVEEWQQRMEHMERRYRVPEELRAKWIHDDPPGSRAGVAYTSTIVSAQFKIDAIHLAMHLAIIAAVTALGATLLSYKSRGDRNRSDRDSPS